MPKATLTFNLPEERVEHSIALHGGEWKNVVYELSMFFRDALKHGHGYKTADEALEAAKNILWDACNAYNLDPWED